jgi:hypothetical protein
MHQLTRLREEAQRGAPQSSVPGLDPLITAAKQLNQEQCSEGPQQNL